MILLSCDYLEGCCPEILEALSRTNLEQTPGYGEDTYCEEARGLIRSLCCAPDADVHFLVGGTQTNATVISSLLKPYQGALCAASGHINVHETGAIEHSGHKVLTLPSTDGKISAAQVREALKHHHNDDGPEHSVQPGMVYISFPTEYGTIYSKKELAELKAVCSEWDIPLYIDGARLGYGLASKSCDLQMKDIAALSDIFYIGGTKQGALFGEAVVICNDKLKKDFRYNIKQNGGLLAKGRLIGLQFLTLFNGGLYESGSRKADELAGKIENAFREHGCRFMVESRTNQIFPILTKAEREALARDFGFKVWDVYEDGSAVCRFCTSWATTDRQAESLCEAIAKL